MNYPVFGVFNNSFFRNRFTRVLRYDIIKQKNNSFLIQTRGEI